MQQQEGLTFSLGTGNRHKCREIAQILGLQEDQLLLAHGFPGYTEPVEDGASFQENALIKARNAHRCSMLPGLADDSGLIVDALGGAPGIHSARYAGSSAQSSENCAKLLAELRKSGAKAPYTARFVCCAVLLFDEQNILCSTGICEGTIITQPAGCGGFGYDPLFVPNGYKKTMAELTDEEKNSLSHRGKAFRLLAKALTVSA